MEELMRRIDNKMQAYELYRRPQDKMMLECMVADYEAKMKLKLQDEAESSTQIQGQVPPW
jgi:hypothetical protein